MLRRVLALFFRNHQPSKAPEPLRELTGDEAWEAYYADRYIRHAEMLRAGAR